MADKDIEQARREAEQGPLVWMIELEQARAQNDFARAAQAQRQLKALGVKISYSKEIVQHA